VLANDIVYVWLPGTTDYEYEVHVACWSVCVPWLNQGRQGFVHNVGQDHVLLNLCLDFHRRYTQPLTLLLLALWLVASDHWEWL
jgi:hypothetical protein